MTARIGADDVGFFESPRTGLLRQITGIEPEPSGIHVLLDKHAGVRSAQRLALGESGGGIVVGLWPAELKPQAEYLYQSGRGVALVNAARERDWQVSASPHLAFFTSPASRRLYMAPDIDAAVYAERWEGADGRQIGQHTVEELGQDVWPWLVDRGYASPHDGEVLEEFLTILGNRKAHLRPGMRFYRRWYASDVERAGTQREFAALVRDDLDHLLAAANEPSLPASS